MIDRLQRAAVTEGLLAPGRSDRPATRDHRTRAGNGIQSKTEPCFRALRRHKPLARYIPCAVLAWLMA
jgi:hypothetical protein